MTRLMLIQLEFAKANFNRDKLHSVFLQAIL